MSLLLDALKKAADKKAKQSAEDEVTAVTKSVLGDSHADTQIGVEPEIDSTVLDATEMDATVLDSTQVDATQIDATVSDSTQVDATQIDATVSDSTQVDATQIDATVSDSTQVDATQIDATVLDSTQVDATQIDATISDSTQVDATQIDATVSDPPQVDATEIEATQSGETGHQQTEAPTRAEQVVDDTHSHTLTDADRSLFILDEDDDDVVIGEENQVLSEMPDTELIDEKGTTVPSDTLTEDDVTAFMGGPQDVYRSDPVLPSQATLLQSDDTTITSEESLSLTNYQGDEYITERKDDTEYSVPQVPSLAEVASRGGEEEILSPQRAGMEVQHFDEGATHAEHGKSSGEVTSSTVDIENLTSDETVTIKSTTETRTYAADNYDRTLMKLADKDVSQLFSGMKSETDTIMTPEYAKKVFLTKSKGAKRYYYKIYTGIAMLILFSVIIWGLFRLQTESEMIDNRLVRLKRDPMPGVIKPISGLETKGVFASESTAVDTKIVELISRAEGTEQANIDEVKIDQGETEIQTPINEVQSDPIAQRADTAKAGGSEGSTNIATAKKVLPQARKPVAQSAVVQISSSSRVADKDRILTSAYENYEAGDITTARRQYDQVLSMEPENRDARLGRAAIHIYDNEFEKAILHYQRLLLANPKDSVAMTSFISLANIDPQAGETQIKNLLRDQPESPYLHFALGNMYGSQKRWSEAQSSYFSALKFKPDDPNYAYNLAVSLEHIEKPDVAVAYYQRALDNRENTLATFDSQLVGERIEVLSQ